MTPKQEDLLDIALYVVKKMGKNSRLDLLLNLVPDNKKEEVLKGVGFGE